MLEGNQILKMFPRETASKKPERCFNCGVSVEPSPVHSMIRFCLDCQQAEQREFTEARAILYYLHRRVPACRMCGKTMPRRVAYTAYCYDCAKTRKRMYVNRVGTYMTRKKFVALVEQIVNELRVYVSEDLLRLRLVPRIREILHRQACEAGCYTGRQVRAMLQEIQKSIAGLEAQMQVTGWIKIAQK